MIHSCTLLLRRVAAPVLILLFSFVPAFAQLEQGRWLVGGGLGGISLSVNENLLYWNGNNFTTNYQSQASIAIGSGLGYCIANNLVVGGSFNTGVNVRGEENFNQASVDWYAGVGSSLRYYAISLSPNAALYGGIYIGYRFGLLNAPYLTIPIHQHWITPSISIGGTWFLTRNVAIEAAVVYERRFSLFGELQQQANGIVFRRVPAYSINTGFLSFGVGFQMFLDKLF